MILDEDVRQFFRGNEDKPGTFGGGGSLQIYRGKPQSLWQDAHPGGCTRHLIVFNKTRVIPRFCFDCYKILIEPRTVVELFKLLMVFERIALPDDNSRKCMIEGREDSSGAYKGFIYCRSIKEGKKVLDIMQKVVADEVSPDIPVVLKRGCSEYTAAYPMYSPSEPGVKPMEYNKAWQAYEDLIDSNLNITEKGPAVVNAGDDIVYTPAEIFAMHYWLRYAATIGDKSYLKLTDREVLPIPQLKRPPFVGAG